jgi:hypothetical protein
MKQPPKSTTSFGNLTIKRNLGGNIERKIPSTVIPSKHFSMQKPSGFNPIITRVQSLQKSGPSFGEIYARAHNSSKNPSNLIIRHKPANTLQPVPQKSFFSSSITVNDEASDEEQFVAVRPDFKQQRIVPELNFEIPQRPDSNTQLIAMLARYRVIARYLLLKKKIIPFNFDNFDSEYINVYKSLKK